MPSNKDCRFTGKEPSPKGFGFCAHLEKEGTVKRGRDGTNWVVKSDKNGVLSWKRAPGSSKAKTARVPKVDSSEFESLFMGPRNRWPAKRKTFYYPAKKIKARAALSADTHSKRGYLTGQGVFSNKLAIISDDPMSNAHWKKVKSVKGYSMNGYLVTGSGGDPVFVIL